MVSDKANTICVLKVLEEYSDEDHILPMRELLSKLRVQFDAELDRRTVYSAVAMLLSLGYDISTYEENGKGYYLRSRLFEPSEVHLLMDAVCSFPFLPAKQSSGLIRKLQLLLSAPKRKQIRNLNVIREDGKTPNRQVFYSIEMLDEAIEKAVQVRFTYLHYTPEKLQVPRRAEPYQVSPYRMVYTNQHYYLVCRMAGTENISLYRIDRMRDIQLTEIFIDRDNQGSAQENVHSAIFAFTGKPERISFLCAPLLLDQVIDQFGSGIHIATQADGRLKFSLTASPKGIKFWALQNLPYVEILEPEWLRKEVIESIQKSPYKEDVK